MKQKYEIQQLQTYDSKHQKNFNSISCASIDSPFQQMICQNTQLYKHNQSFGKIRIVYENQRFLFTIGPDYVCFCIAYILFTIMNFVIIYTAYMQIQNFWVNIVNVIVALIQNLSYLAVALSNPGIQTKNTLPTQEDAHEEIKRFCKKCNIKMQKGTHHCRQCDVCIRNYDHHCPWTSKCIGQKNLTKFYVFVTSTMIYIVYSVVMLIICMAKSALQIERNLKSNRTL